MDQLIQTSLFDPLLNYLDSVTIPKEETNDGSRVTVIRNREGIRVRFILPYNLEIDQEQIEIYFVDAKVEISDYPYHRTLEGELRSYELGLYLWGKMIQEEDPRHFNCRCLPEKNNENETK